MKRSILTRFAALAILTLVAPAGAELCGKCKGRTYVQALGKCTRCAGMTSSSGYKLCRKCGEKAGQCQACLVSLKGDAGKPTEPKTPAFKERRWGGKFRDAAMRSRMPKAGVIADNAAWAKLWKAWRKDAVPTVDFTKELVVLQAVDGPNDVLVTARLEPSGNLHVLAAATKMGGPGFGYGMLTVVRKGVRTINGKPVPRVGSVAAAAVAFTEADNGKTVKATVGQMIVVTLKANATTRYSWAVANAGGPALQQVGKIAYKADAASKGTVGVGGVSVATFKAVQAGTATIELQYCLPGEMNKGPAKAFSVTIQATAKKSSPTVTGRIDFRQAPAVNKISRIVVSIRNTAIADGPAPLIGTVELKGPFKLPVTFAVPYDPARVRPNPRFYSISARVYTKVGGRERLYYINDTRHHIFRTANDTTRDVQVKKLR